MGSALVPATGVGEEIGRQFQALQIISSDQQATGDLVIVEIDGRSLQELDRWPWPREHYAHLVTRLSDAGAEMVAFDVDLSAESNPEQDAALADALEDSEATIVLPTFKQKAAAGDDAYVESTPIGIFRKSAILASVNVLPDAQGRLDKYSYATVTGGVPRPSLASVIAGHSGTADTLFPIDQAIAPDTIPRYSFADLAYGPDGDLKNLAGKKFLVGATAIELGDRYPTSQHGVQAGVVIQAMAAETLMRGTDFSDFGFAPPLALAALIVLLLLARSDGRVTALGVKTVAIAIGLTVILATTQHLKLATFSNLPAFGFLALFVLIENILHTDWALRNSKLVHTLSQLPNEAAFEEFLEGRDDMHVVVGRIRDYGDLLEVVPQKMRPEFLRRIADRLRLVACREQVFHLEDGMFGWLMIDDYRNDIDTHFDAVSALFQSPVVIGGQRLNVSAGFGVSMESIDQAKFAAGHAAADGKLWAWHDEELSAAAEQKVSLLADLAGAIASGELWVAYQPKWDLARDRLEGAEALARWSHPVKGEISPGVFIPILETSGHIASLTLHMVAVALRDLAEWNRFDPDLHCSVNISAALLTDARFVERVIQEVSDAAIDSGRLIFEITETAELAEFDKSVRTLERFREAGVAISIDDYGTGQSTMSYLRRLPADEIKIDQVFVKTIEHDAANRIMVGSTIQMAHALGLKVVAEGIEDERCLDILKQFGCDIGQGWHISRPVAPNEFKQKWVCRDQAKIA